MRQQATITISLPVVIELGPPVEPLTLNLRVGPVRDRTLSPRADAPELHQHEGEA